MAPSRVSFTALSAPRLRKRRWPHSAIGLRERPRRSFSGFATGLFGIIPGGPAIIWLPAAIWLFRSGETAWGIFLVLWSALLVGNIDNVIRPLFVSRGSALPLLVVLIGIIGGAMALGFIGIFLGPTILAILYSLMREWSPGEFFGGRPAETSHPPFHEAVRPRRQVDQQAYGPDGSRA